MAEERPRPSPEELLHRVQEAEKKENRGKLKIYLGAAPGVGKTYEMLHDALQEREKGLDVVIGVIESHGRTEIESMLNEFEILPRKSIDYHGKQLTEFDLDLTLKRHPGLILIDEMAHTNAPGSRHAKRWRDIKEVLDRGIDVYTTLNVQHIESLNDDITQIIHAPIKETVPDSMIEIADTIEVVDIPPEELLKRLHEGKVYIPKQAALAAEHFFRKGNLISLRELALRITAEHVGAEVLLYRQGEGIKHIWPIKDKILVCVGPNPESLKLIRAAKRMANSLQAKWIAVYIDKPQLQSSGQKRNNAIQNLRLAEQLGAEIRVLTGFDIVKELLNFAREQNVTQIMLWKHIRTRWRDWLRPSLADEIVRQSGEIDVYIMTGVASNIPTKKSTKQTKPFPWKMYAFAIGIITICTIINFIIQPYLAPSNLIMVYLLGVTVIACYGQIGPSITASVLSVLLFNFWFSNPYYNATVPTQFGNLFTLIVMLLVTQVISHLTILLRRQAESAHLTQHQTTALYTLSRQLSNSRGTDKLLDAGTKYIADYFNCDVLALLPKNNHLEIHSTDKSVDQLDVKEQGIAQWVYELGQMAGLGTDTLSFSHALYMPLLASQGSIGVLRIYPKTQLLLTPEEMRLLEACVNQIALALEVDRLQDQQTKKELETVVDDVRARLLHSVSHDLRTPLLAVMAGASNLMELGEKLDGKKIKQTGSDIYFETEQLSRLINNLLQITYLESHNVKLQIQPSSLEDVINLVIKTSSKKLQNRAVIINLPRELPLIPFDRTLIQEVFFNLIDNAVKFTPVGSPIEVETVLQSNDILINVSDHGPGIMPDELNKLFEKYYRGRMLTSERGLGLGLAICRSIVTAHGGEIWAENRKEGGVTFSFTLPLSATYF